MSDKREKTLDEVMDLVRNQNIAMLSTMDGRDLVSRPMGMQEPDEDGTLWFITRTNSDVTTQVAADPRVNIALADGDYISITGQASVVHDPARAKELWGPFVETWMQCEPEDPEVALIRVNPETISYWETPGAVATAFSMVRGMVGDHEPKLGESGTVEA